MIKGASPPKSNQGTNARKQKNKKVKKKNNYHARSIHSSWF